MRENRWDAGRGRNAAGGLVEEPMCDDLVERLEGAAKLGLDLCREAADAVRSLEAAAAAQASGPLIVADTSLEVQVEAEQIIDRVVASLGVRELMARSGMDAELVGIEADAEGGAVATINLYGAGFGASALLHVADRLKRKPETV